MSNINDKSPQNSNESNKKDDAHEQKNEYRSMFDEIKDYFKSIMPGTAESVPSQEAPDEKPVAENAKPATDAEKAVEALEQKAQGEAEEDIAKKKADEGDKPKELTLEDIEKMQAAAAGEAQDSGFSIPPTIQHNNRGEVDSLARDLGLSPFPPALQKVEPTLVTLQTKEDHSVSIIDLTPKTEGGDAVVNEDDLLASRGPGESAGSDPTKESTTVQGDFKIIAPDGVGELRVDGHLVIDGGTFIPTTIDTPLGNKLSITGYDPNTGTVTYEYTLLDNEQHPQGNGTNSIFEDFHIFLRDTDDDTADGTLSVRIIDDVPSIVVSDALASLIVDETNLNINATGSFAGLFNSVAGADGATIVYQLSISQEGADSGLVDSASNSHVLLFMDGNDVVGRAGNDEVFRISLDPNNGNVTLDQSRAIIHGDPNNPDESTTLSSSDLIKITATITDGDGDVASAIRDIGQSFIFKDDAPSGTISLKPGTFIATDESAGLQGPETAAPAGSLGQTTVAYSNFLIDNTSYGEDGAGTKTYSLSVVDGTASGFKTSDGAQDIVLINNNGVIEGHVGNSNGALAFTISADANGVTLTQYLAVAHSPDSGPNQLSGGMSPGVLTLVETVTDADGDHIQPGVDLGSIIKFYDDAPSGTISLKPDVFIATDESAGQQGPETAAPAGTLGQATVAYSDLLIDNTSFGSDGAGTKTYSLSVVDGTASGFKTPDGTQDIVLVNNNGVIEGHVGNSNGALAFTISADANGVTLTQYLAVAHSPDSGPNQLSGGMNPGVLTLIETVTDADGDHIQPGVDLGSVIKFYDDAPSGTISLKPGAFIATDESAGLQGPETAAPAGTLGQTTIAYSNLLVDNSSFGSDGAGTKIYNLSVVDGTASGFKTSDGAQDIVLVNNNGVIEGHVGNSNGALAFTISADANGVTLTQYLAVAHSPDSGPNQLSGGMNPGVLTLTQIVTDADGDSTQSAVDLGSAIKFYDDAPSGTIYLKPEAFIATDESAGLQGPETAAPAGTLGQTTVAYSNFLIDNTSFGSDGAGTKTYSLSVVDGTASGFKTSNGAQDIVLVNNGGVVEGHVGNSNGALAFTISADANGVTLTQYLAVAHSPDAGPNQLSGGMNPGVLTLIQVVTDADGDSTQSAVNLGSAIKFYDDAPHIDVNQIAAPSLVVDESNFLINDSKSFAGLFTSSFGSDGPKDTDQNGVADSDAITYKLGILAPGANSGLVDTDSNQAVVLSLENGVVVGRAGIGGAEVFKISVDADTGVITLDQSRAVVHSNQNDPNDSTMLSADNLITLTATIRDGDLDSDSATKDIGQAFKFQDDGPTAVDDCFSVPLPVQPAYNLTFVLDVSGSMDTTISGNKTRLDLLKEALTSNGALLDSYAAASSALAITIVTFSGNAQISMEFHDVAAAKAYIDALSAGGTTNYQAAANVATGDINSDNANPNLSGYIDRLYWLSDGEPNPANTALTDAQELAWRNLLNADNVEAYMLNIGSSNQAEINENLADLDDDQPGTVITVAPDLSNLQQILIDTINQSEVQGNVLANDAAGADAHPAVVNIYFLLADNAAANAYLAAHPELVGATVDGNKVTIPIPNADITTPLGNILHIETDGDFTYTTKPHDDPNQGDEDLLYYTMKDGDGDKSSAEFCFDVDLGVTITNLTPKAQGGDVTVDEDDLLANRGPNESAGSDTTKESTTQPGSFNISAPNGVDDVTVGGHAVITDGVFTATSFTTPLGNTLSIVGYNSATGEITYTYTLNDNEAHPNANGENALFEDFAVTLTDTDGDSANATLSARIIDDVPDAINDVNPNVASENSLVLNGNVRTNDTQGADGASVTPVNLVGTYGSIVINADGSYVYTLNPNDADFKALGGGGVGVENFNYTLTDADGDADTAKLTLNIKNDDDGVLITDLTPKAQGGDAVVDEDDLLASRGPGESAGSDPTKESTTTTGDFKINAPDGIASLTVDGHNVIVNNVFTATSFTTALGNTLNITGYNAATGTVSYSYTLNDNENHPTGNGENSIFEDFGVVLKDTDGDIANDTLSVKIIDDVPTAVDDCFTIPLPVQPSYNLTFVLDISGSMDTVLPNTGGKTRLELLQEALTNNGALLDSYAAASTALKITIVTFSSSAQTSMEFSDVAAAKAFINGLDANGSTNYQAAANAATADINSDNANPALSGYIDRIYWLSDGEPNPTSTALTDAQELAWRNLLNADHVEAYMLNIGSTNQAEINENLADLDDDQPGTVITVAPDLSNLQQILIDTINQSEVKGNVLTNDTIGADGNGQVVNIYFSLADNAAANAYLAAHPELSGASVNGNIVTIPIPNADITTPLGNTLHIETDGDFTYTSKVENGVNGDEDTLYYTMKDGDGDTSNAEFCFDIDFGVTITNLTPKAQGGDVTVDEDDLLASRGANESAGSDSSKESTTQPGSFNISAPNGVDDVSIGGHAVITNGVFSAISFATPLGNTLSIIGYNSATGEITYTYTLNDNEAHPNANGENAIFEDFAVNVTDIDGDSANATLSARVIDDVPTAVNDINASIASENSLILTGNVKTNDTQGADGASVTPLNLVGTYGSIVINADGSYVYTINPNDTDFKALGGGGVGVENFNYNLVDADGDSSSAKLTLNIKNDDDGVTITDLTPKAQGGDASVDEDDLLASRGPGESAGSDPTKESTTTTGDFKISAPDGIASLTIDGHNVIVNDVFTATSFTTALGNTLNITGFNAATGVVSYNYTLNDNESHPAGNGENSIFEDFNVALQDKDGDSSNNTLSIKIVDDVPDAIDDTNASVASENNIILVGNVKTNDIPGADGASVTPVNLVGTYGSIVINADGSYVYTLNPNDADFKALNGGSVGVENFNYTLTDADGDADSAKLTLNIKNDDDGVTITDLTPKAQGGDASVDEDDLLASRGPGESAGSDPTKESTTTTGDFKISAPDGIGSLVIDGHNVIVNDVFTATSFTTALGNTLNITGFNAATGVVSYSYTLNDNESHPAGNGENSIFEDFNVALQDKDGDSSNNTLSIKIVDDVPDAIDDTNASAASENNLILSGNVRTNDTQGADGASVTPVNLVGTYGSIVINADGSYVYTLNANDADFKALNGGSIGVENFNYTLTDADGDADSAKLTLNIKNDDDGVTITDLTPKAQGGDASVDEDDLLASRGPGESAGSDPTKESTTTTGDFKISAPDGVGTLSIGGHNVIVNDVFTATSFTTPLGNTLNITGYNAATGVVSYSYTLNDNENHPTGNGENSIFEDFNVALQDRDGDSTNNSLSIKIVDDVPTAVEDCFTVPLPVQPAYNLTFVLDISGSMDTILPNTNGKTRLELLQEALTNNGALLDSYAAASTALKITIVTFSSSAQTSMEFSDVAAAKAFINGLDANGTTNYQAAANAATVDINADNANPALSGYIDRLYWLSDGEPNPTSTALTDAQELAWRNLLNADHVEAYMLNIGSTNQTEINENLADLDDDQPGTVITVAPDLSNLQQILIDTINQSEVKGNVLTNDTIGADGNGQVVNVYFALADNAAANAYLAAHPELTGASVNGNIVIIPVPNGDITTPLGNTLHIETDGDFTYTSKAQNGVNGDEDTLYYTMKDGDGDTSNAEFCFSIDFGVTITNLTPKAQGGDVSVNEDDLLASRGANESAGSDTTKESTKQSGSFNVTAPNGLTDLSIGGHTVIANGVFTATSFTTALGSLLAITAYNPATGEIKYDYTLMDNVNHPDGNGKNSLYEDFSIAAKDADGSVANNTLSVQIIDDAPDAINDANANFASESNLVLTGNLKTNDILGADGAAVTAFSATGKFGSIVVDAAGNYTYTLNTNDADFKALGGGGIGSESFNYTLKDGDGDSDTATLTLNIRNNNDGVLITDVTPKANGGDASVNEDDLLASRGANESAGSDSSKESTTVSGDFKISAPDGIDDLSVGGHAIITNGVFSATSFATSLGNTISFTGYNAATGVVSYNYTLNDNENHPTGNGANNLFDDMQIVLSDVDGSSATDTLSIKIIDDVPTAVNDAANIVKPALPSYNLVFVIDVSGSMDEVVQGSKTRLDVLQEAITNSGALLDSYKANSSNLNITFVTFSTNAQTSSSFTDVQAAKNFVNALDANGSTNYIAAMSNAQTVMNANNSNPNLTNYIDKIYFLSDGQPNVGVPSNSQYNTWRTTLSNDNFDSIVLNIAPPANQQNVNQYLTPLANPGDNPAVYSVNADLSNLQSILISTIADLAHINGNILTNDIQGADGHLVVSQIQFSFASSAAASAYLSAHPELAGATVNGSSVTIPVPQNADIVTPLGEKLHIETDGDYTYTIDGNAQTGKTDTFTYTAVDTDGDPTSAQVQLSIVAPQTMQMTVTSFAASTDSQDSSSSAKITTADTHDSSANNDVAFVSSHSSYADNVTSNDVIGDKGAKVVEISFETEDAAKYIKDNNLDSLNAVADKDGKTVHIALPGDGSEVEFKTPDGGSLAINSHGEYVYSVNGAAQDQVEHFKYTLQDLASGNLHQANLDVSIFENPNSLVSLMGSDANDIMSTANHNASVIMMEAGKGINDFIIDIGNAHAPETIFIKDLGMNKQNILSFVGVSDANHDGKVSFIDAIESFHQDAPNANIEITLQNKSTLILENAGTVPGHDMQALQQHLESITAELHVTK
ncbi:DUF5801 repeats-in-toxin domain-containing protein [Candidatus Berkiella aquae]|uniref:VWA domain-containing protein n=1 Tax=Candidatus Berkiella aquae TaxID=295108 RepID=A0A0Q9YN35_9GAMM|nr:DUF5801 repeats-in-toxin domain-containing protein [Candidatus Berkiella aquae]MCS5710873.1 VWA domain-containing protein [Candidatus Berkiella aquae]